MRISITLCHMQLLEFVPLFKCTKLFLNFQTNNLVNQAKQLKPSFTIVSFLTSKRPTTQKLNTLLLIELTIEKKHIDNLKCP